jgi:hypothetical protein
MEGIHRTTLTARLAQRLLRSTGPRVAIADLDVSTVAKIDRCSTATRTRSIET